MSKVVLVVLYGHGHGLFKKFWGSLVVDSAILVVFCFHSCVFPGGVVYF